jgi:hypothetical protein
MRGRRSRQRVASEGRSPTDPEVDRFYGLPLGEFTRARNALAARLARAGQTDEAATVRRLQKPSAPVWAVNQAVRQDPQAAERFIDAVERLRDTQAGRPAELAAATERHRTESSQLIAGARSALTGAGFSDSPEMMARVSKTLLGGAVSRPAELRAGRLTEELGLPGFEALTGIPAELAERPDEVVTPSRRQRGESDGDRVIRERQERAHEALKVAEAEAQEWEERAEKLGRAARQHGLTREEAEGAVAELRARLHEAEARATEARRGAEQAEREADRARREAERADARRAAARKALSTRRQAARSPR